jgi:hypothetical protein
MTAPAEPKVSIFDTPSLTRASYVAQVGPGDFAHPGFRVGLEHGRYHCKDLVALLETQRMRDRSGPDTAGDLAVASSDCKREIADQLTEARGFLFVIDDAGSHWVTADEVIASSLPIDTPAKALLVAWSRGYEVGWYDGTHSYGTIEDGQVHAVDGGFEVACGATHTEQHCGSTQPRARVTVSRLTLFVDRAGKVAVRDQTTTHGYDVSDPCHPL